MIVLIMYDIGFTDLTTDIYKSRTLEVNFTTTNHLSIWD